MFYNRGVPAVSLVTDKAKVLFEKIADRIDCREERYEDFLPWQSWGKNHNPNPELRKMLFEQLMNVDITLRETIETIHSRETLKQKVIRYAKNIVRKLPLSWEKRIRWIFYKF